MCFMIEESAKFVGVIKLIQLFDTKTGRSDSAYFIVRWFAAELSSTNLSIHFDKHEPMENDDKPF